ncbi:tetratricopeptide repeat protein [Helicobacter aurati]|uniref:Tetratricopeptide repeat protein n=1 Tax=Helicobacter aurati TaxID=137778 RepID=A0A3D8J6N0_9HELI|nr:tetratricopeptide repeat-containing glycosyltransferase family protein [Helicobacter aurati]RDU72855.1 tetratricopeptide repeat protein [Helicobacter aurati]
MDMNIAQHYFNNAQYSKCVESCLQVIAKSIENIEAWGLCALSYEKLGRRSEAIDCLQEALKIDKVNGGANAFFLSLNLAEFYRRSDMTLQAIALLSSFLPRQDENLHFNLAKCYGDLQDYEQSIKHYTMAIQINPADMHAVFNLANQQAAIGSLKTALKYYLLAYEGGIGDAGINLAQTYADLGNIDSALALYQQLEPMYSKDSNFYFNYANTLCVAGDIELAKQAYIKALSLYGDVRYIINLAYLFLSIEDFEQGFSLYEHRRPLLASAKTNHFPKHFLDFGLRDKNEILRFIEDKKVALYHEQGFGDSIMFARFIPLLLCKQKILFVSKELCALLSCFNLEVYTTFSEDYDVAIPLPSLAFLLADSLTIRESLQEFSALLLQFLNNHPKESAIQEYLGITLDSEPHKPQLTDLPTTMQQTTHAIPTYQSTKEESSSKRMPNNDKKISQVAQQAQTYSSTTTYTIGDKILRVGLNFSSNPHFQDARKKSLYPQKLLESLPREGLQYVSLQYEGLDSDLSQEYHVLDMCEHIKDFHDSALIIKNLDLVISIDSAVAHLSASLGIETLVLLHKKHDWRWGKIGQHKTTIWYDKTQLFIQEIAYQWDKPLKELQKYLEKKARF